MAKNSRIKFLIIAAVTIIVVFFAIIVFQLVKIFQYNSKLNKLEDQIEKNRNIIAYYQNLSDDDSSSNPQNEQTGDK